MTANDVIHTNPLDLEEGTYFLTGNETLARAALVSHVTFFSSYPGAPITGVSKIMMDAKHYFRGLHSEYSINEAAAVFGATGASWSGARALVTMKHVGMHVSCDPIAYLGYTGTVGGLVLAVGMDPGAKCSTGEFDVRHLNDAFHWVMLEPSNTAEVYEYALRAFELSEHWQMPVLLIMPTELCNQYGTVYCKGICYEWKEFSFKKNEKYINNGITAVKHHQELLFKIKNISEQSDNFLDMVKRGNGDTAIITSGCNYLAVIEALDMLNIEDVTVIKLGMTYPLPEKMLANELQAVRKILVAEELDGYLSKHILAFVKKWDLKAEVRSINKSFLSAGTLSMDSLLNSLSEKFKVAYEGYTAPADVPNISERPGTFCAGCPHRGILYVLKRMCGEDHIYGGDIGCSSLPPYYSDWLTCMGSGLGIAHGVSSVLKRDDRAVYASMGDSTFFHCGIPIIVNTMQQDLTITVLILDNRWTAMTGHQPLPHTDSNNHISIFNIVKALGVKYVWEADAYNLDEFRKILVESRPIKGLKIIVVKGECRLKYLHSLEKAKPVAISCKNVEQTCHQCGECYKVLGCPAIKYQNEMYQIDENLCSGCGVCAQICPNHSISSTEYVEV